MAGMRLGKGVELMPHIEFPKPEAMGDPGMKGGIGLWWGSSCPSETGKTIFSSPCLLWRRESQGSLCRHYCLSAEEGGYLLALSAGKGIMRSDYHSEGSGRPLGLHF